MERGSETNQNHATTSRKRTDEIHQYDAASGEGHKITEIDATSNAQRILENLDANHSEYLLQRHNDAQSYGETHGKPRKQHQVENRNKTHHEPNET